MPPCVVSTMPGILLQDVVPVLQYLDVMVRYFMSCHNISWHYITSQRHIIAYYGVHNISQIIISYQVVSYHTNILYCVIYHNQSYRIRVNYIMIVISHHNILTSYPMTYLLSHCLSVCFCAANSFKVGVAGALFLSIGVTSLTYLTKIGTGDKRNRRKIYPYPPVPTQD